MSGSSPPNTCTIFIWFVIFLLNEENVLSMHVKKKKTLNDPENLSFGGILDF